MDLKGKIRVLGEHSSRSPGVPVRGHAPLVLFPWAHRGPITGAGITRPSVTLLQETETLRNQHEKNDGT